MRFEPGFIVSNRYEIDTVLGKGGMAVVYRALDRRLGRYITLKVLKDEYSQDEDYVRRFPSEAQAAAALNHPNIVQIYDNGKDGDICYIVLEYIDGTNLKTLINRKAPFENDTTIAIAIQIAEGLAEAHSYNIIHRDVKPQNILVTANSSVKVTDFGIARVAKASTLTQGVESMGSVHYFSPEQARRGFVDNKSDIYALGITMFEMATGTLPFDGDSTVTIALQHLNDPLPDMVALNPNISESLKRIILKATEKSPTKRYQSMEQITEDLKRAYNDENGAFVTSPVSVSPTPVQEEAHYDDDEYYDTASYDEEEDDEYEEVFEDKREERKVMLYGALFALPLILIITLLSFGIYRWRRNDWIEMIDLTGMNVYAARAWADDKGLELLLTEAHHDEMASGYLFGQVQTPDFNTLRPGDTVHANVSVGPYPYFDMPEIVGYTYEDARTALMEIAGEMPFSIERVELTDATLPRDKVVAQEPMPGIALQSGGTVILQVSVGPEITQIQVPNLIGQPYSQAIALATAAGLIVGAPDRRENMTFEEGLVFGQDLAPYETVERNAVIIISISTGAPVAPTPSPTPTPTPEPEVAPTPSPTPTPPDTGDDTTDTDTPQTGSITIALPPVLEQQLGPHYLVIFLRIGGDDPVLLFRDPNAPAHRFPLRLTETDLNNSPNMPRPLTGTGDELFMIYFMDENGAPIWRGEQIFFFD